jgi:hypothetical protein
MPYTMQQDPNDPKRYSFGWKASPFERAVLLAILAIVLIGGALLYAFIVNAGV